MENKAFLHAFYSEVYEQGNRLTKQFLVTFAILGIALGAVHGTWWIGLAGAIFNLSLFFVPQWLGANKAHIRYVISFLFGNFSLQVILQLKGSYPAFFVYFLCFTLLMFFENWKVLLPITIHAIASTCVIFYVASIGKIQSLPNLPPLGIYEITGQLFLIIALAGICMYWSRLQRGQTTQSAEAQWHARQQLASTEANMKFATELSHGNLQTEYAANTTDSIGAALLTMRKSLIASKEREDQERFHTTGLAEIGELLRKFSNNLDELGNQVIEKLVKYMKANQGSLFVMDDQGQALKLLASRAWERKKFLNKTVQLGEGLIGQVALEKETIYMTKVPENYISITSGLGQANPRSVILVPLKSETVVVGVIELASFHEFAPYEIQFLEKVGESIASTIITARNNQKTRELLDSSKEQEEQLRAQEEEMRQNMEEMQATQEEMARAQNEIYAKSQELEIKQANMDSLINSTDDSILLMDKNYVIVLMNDVLRNRYKGTQYEKMDVGANALDGLGAVRDEWKGYYDRALSGERLNFTIKSTVKGENMFREYFINPVKSAGVISGLSVFSRDVSKHHNTVDEMMKKSALLDGIINQNSDTYFAIDTEYKILVVNEVLHNRFKAVNIDLKPGTSILEKLPKETLALWKERYDKGIAGEKLRIKEERKVGNNTLFLEVFVDPIFQNDAIIGCSVVSRDITELKNMQDRLAKMPQAAN